MLNNYTTMCSSQKSRLEFEFIDVLRHMRRYFSHIYDGTDEQAEVEEEVEVVPTVGLPTP